MQDTPTARPLGQFLKARRIELRKAMSRFCGEVGVDVSNYSKIERGGLVPGDETLGRIATGLGIEPGTPDMETLTDLVATARGRLPADIVSQERLMELMPAFYQRLRRHGEVSTSSGVYQILVDTIREG